MANARKKKKGFSLALIFIPFAFAGVVMLAGGFIFMGYSLHFQSIAVEVSGTITSITTHRDSDGDTSHTVLVSYSYEGQDFDNTYLGFYSSNMYEGKEITLLIDPGNPRRMTSPAGNTFACIMLLGMGLIFSLVGFIPLTRMSIHSRREKKLLTEGKLLQATVERIDLNQSVTYNGRHPYLIFCTYWDAYQDVTYRFKSKDLTQEPGYAPGCSPAVCMWILRITANIWYMWKIPPIPKLSTIPKQRLWNLHSLIVPAKKESSKSPLTLFLIPIPFALCARVTHTCMMHLSPFSLRTPIPSYGKMFGLTHHLELWLPYHYVPQGFPLCLFASLIPYRYIIEKIHHTLLDEIYLI